MDSFRTFVDLLAVTSGLVAVSQFLLPTAILDWADSALAKGLKWIEQRRYAEFRQRMAAGAYNNRILQIGSALLLLNGVVSCVYKLAVTPMFGEHVVTFFIFQTLVFIFSLAAFVRFGIPLVQWVFAGRGVWLTFLKTALALVVACGVGLAAFVIGVTHAEKMTSSNSAISLVDAYFVFGVAFGFPFTILLLVSAFSILAMASFILNGVVSTILVFYLYFVVFMWAAWTVMSTVAFIVRRSFERKGLAFFVASISTLLSAIMRFAPH